MTDGWLDPRRWDSGPGAGQRAGSFLGALTFGTQTGKWLLILAVVLVLGGPVLAMLGVY